MISVKEDNLLSVNIGRGLILAECLPINLTKIDQKPAVLFKAEFSNLSGSGKIKLASTADKTGNYSLNTLLLKIPKTDEKIAVTSTIDFSYRNAIKVR